MTDATPIDGIGAQPVAQQLRTVLHVSCGLAHPAKLPDSYFPLADWHELRLDSDPSVTPDILARPTDLSMLADASVDAIWSSHSLTHLAFHEVAVALGEFLRVLKPGGFFLVTLPDLQQVAKHVAEGHLEEPVYISAAGPISPLDILYGHRAAQAEGQIGTLPRTGFTARSLAEHLTAAGFAAVKIESDGRFALWGVGTRPDVARA
ncbi:methyltransferase family protein [Rhodobacter viridis]|uniref:Methyltransferase family protein n=1 Tax=Rhodobacter viridis TaxID=1054202 RepID=A0A318TP60_9RHOB|nr:methyltransferase domain-containing protein [Rhodobacter viridis]PYF06576.1 methyltransferase family protein [Rhodobacter viridis]